MKGEIEKKKTKKARTLIFLVTLVALVILVFAIQSDVSCPNQAAIFGASSFFHCTQVEDWHVFPDQISEHRRQTHPPISSRHTFYPIRSQAP